MSNTKYVPYCKEPVTVCGYEEVHRHGDACDACCICQGQTLVDLADAAWVSREELMTVCRALGLDPNETGSVHLDHDGIRAELREDGQAYWKFWPVL